MTTETAVSERLGATTRRRAFEFTWAGSRPLARQALSARLGWIGLGGLILGATAIAVGAAGTRVLLPTSLRPIPAWLAGAFGSNGIALGVGGFIAVLTLMFISYGIAIRAAGQLSARAVVIGIVGLHALVLLAPPLLSTDIFSYVAYGRIGALHGSNPYLYGPNAIALDPVYRLIDARWLTTPTAYGPLFTAVSYLLAPLGIASQVVAYKAIAAVSSLTIVALVWHGAQLRDLDPVKAIAVVGLNPLILVFGVGGGHNDLLMIAILVAGVCLLLRQKERASGALIVTAAAVKLTAGLLAPFAIAHNASTRGGTRNRHGALIGACLGAVLAGAFSFLLFGTGPFFLLSTLPHIQSTGGLNSIPGVILAGLGLSDLERSVGVLLDAGFVIWVVFLLWRVWTGKLDWITGAGWAMVALLVTAGMLLPWYVGWLVPLAALSSDRRLLATSVAMTAIGLTTL